MTDEVPAKKKRRRRNRRRGSGGQAGAAPQAQTAHHDIYNEAANVAEIRAERAAHVQRMQTADELAALLVPMILRPRHVAIFDWLCQGSTAAAVLTAIVGAEVARQLPNYREAQGGGGTTSRNLEALSERIPVRR